MSRIRVDGTVGTLKNKLVYKKGTTRQYQDQMRYKALGLCIKCQKPQATYSKNYCGEHVIYARELQRRILKRKRRNSKCASYIVENGGFNEENE